MNADHPLQELLERLDSPAAGALLMSQRDTGAWPEGLFEELVEAGLLAPASPAAWVECPACADGHTERPIRRGDHYVIQCPEANLVRLQNEDLEQWRLNPTRFAEIAAAALGCRGLVRERIPGRWWTLGDTTSVGNARRVLFVRGSGWDGASEELGDLHRSVGAHDLLLVLTAAFAEAERECVALDERATWEHGRLRISLIGLPATRPLPTERFLFRAAGDVREVQFGGGPVFHVRRTKGVEDMARLLAAPSKPVDVMDLVGPTAAAPADIYPAAEGLPIRMASGVQAIDRTAIVDLRTKIQAIDDQLNERIDAKRATELTQERGALQRHLNQTTNIRGAPRFEKGDVDRGRTAVAKRIRSAINRIAEHDQDLAHHLDRYIETGHFVVYKPDTPIRWEI